MNKKRPTREHIAHKMREIREKRVKHLVGEQRGNEFCKRCDEHLDRIRKRQEYERQTAAHAKDQAMIDKRKKQEAIKAKSAKPKSNKPKKPDMPKPRV